MALLCPNDNTPEARRRGGLLAAALIGLLSVTAAPLAATAAAAPPPAPDERAGHPPSDPRAHPVRGGFLPAERLADRVADPRAYKVRAAPPGYSWIHVGHDLILAQDRSGLIVDIVEGVYP
jgi:hypothetical protein